MKINIASCHRFHLLDLAIELEKCGHDVTFYSYVPKKRTIKFGLSKRASYSLFIPCLPFLAVIKLSGSKFWSLRIMHIFLDNIVSLFMKPCDVFIGLGTVYKYSFLKAKRKYAAKVILEWGSKHIEVQQRILNKIDGINIQPHVFTTRSLFGYDIADYIAIPSDHVKLSFIENGILETKLFQNMYGVDVSMFKPTKLAESDVYDVIMVGSWSYRKGCDLLIDFFKSSKLRFLHVGAIVDLPFPSVDNMTHVEPVEQSQLLAYYSKARVFVLPSREEGLAMVQIQALVCGLPIVCTKDTGGRDLRVFLENKEWVIEMKEFGINYLNAAIIEALELAKMQPPNIERNYLGDIENGFTWQSYGQRYDNFLRNHLL
jgi:glycosyltransferase involved in cell wall biosynthesis